MARFGAPVARHHFHPETAGFASGVERSLADRAGAWHHLDVTRRPPGSRAGLVQAASFENRQAAIAPLLGAVREELALHDTPHPLFHGAWDWHSSVHGHWALLTYSGYDGRDTHAQWVIDRLRSEAWAAEVEHLVAKPEFELPYGRAWLLALANAYERVTGGRELRRPLAPVVETLHEWCLTTALGPDTQEYLNPCWPLIHLWQWREDEPAPRRALEDRIRERFLGPGSSLASDHDPPGAFFSRWSLQAHLIGQTLGGGPLADWLSEENVDPDSLAPIAEVHSAHHLGTNATRAWGFASAYRATGDARWRDAYERHLKASIALHEAWRDDRYAYRHWVPQFTLYAAHLASEDSEHRSQRPCP